jgi:predicted amidohydrolase
VAILDGCQARRYAGVEMDRYLAAVVQMQSGPDRAANLARAEHLIGVAAARGAALVVLPEVATWRGPRSDERAHFEPVPGPTTDAMGAVAARHGIHLCLGSLLERIDDGPRAHNTACLLGPDGHLLASYRKINLFDVDLPGRVVMRESATRVPGDAVVTADTPLGTLGLSVCYDLRFPELYRRLASAGAELLLVPSAFTLPTGAAHWEVLCRARAIENQCHLLAPNQTGQSPYGFADFGNSLIVDPWGTVLGRAGDGEAVVVAEIDRTRLREVRTQLPSLAHRRLG